MHTHELSLISVPFILAETESFQVRIAATADEIDAALRLRFSVFNLEMNEGLAASFDSGKDTDRYDEHCDHLIVEQRATGRIVGTYRLLRGDVAVRTVGFYSENEFDVTPFRIHYRESLELGRSCVAKEFRSLAVINLLWTGIARYIEHYGISYLFGCASFHTNDASEIAAAYAYLQLFHQAPEEFRTAPVSSCVMELPPRLLSSQEIEKAFDRFPPLVKGYLRLGARICGAPAYDREFGTTDFLIVVDAGRIAEKYRRHYIQEPKAA